MRDTSVSYVCIALLLFASGIYLHGFYTLLYTGVHLDDVSWKISSVFDLKLINGIAAIIINGTIVMHISMDVLDLN